MVRIAVPYSKALRPGGFANAELVAGTAQAPMLPESAVQSGPEGNYVLIVDDKNLIQRRPVKVGPVTDDGVAIRSEEHTSELQSLMRNSYAVFCLQKKKYNTQH